MERGTEDRADLGVVRFIGIEGRMVVARGRAGVGKGRIVSYVKWI